MLLIAPGGMHSSVEVWDRAAINPLAVLGDEYRLIAMDQRNAGRSSGPLDTVDPWGSYGDDQLALMDHLGIDIFHVFGCCIGGSFILKLLEVAPQRVVAGVLEQPIGIANGNDRLFVDMWRHWGRELRPHRPDIDDETLEAFGNRMWAGLDFVVSVSREFVSSCTSPLLVLPGIDEYHPTATGREIAELAPHGEILEPWKDTAENVARAVETVRRFLTSHTPPSHTPPSHTPPRSDSD